MLASSFALSRPQPSLTGDLRLSIGFRVWRADVYIDAVIKLCSISDRVAKKDG